jgi:predicted ArsR family transcriptional regulator
MNGLKQWQDQLDVEILRLLKDGEPRSLTEIERELKVDYDTARRHLMALAMEGHVRFARTTRKLLFWIADKEQAQPARVGPEVGPTRARELRGR